MRRGPARTHDATESLNRESHNISDVCACLWYRVVVVVVDISVGGRRRDGCVDEGGRGRRVGECANAARVVCQAADDDYDDGAVRWYVGESLLLAVHRPSI